MNLMLVLGGVAALIGVVAHGIVGGHFFIGHVTRQPLAPLGLPGWLGWLAPTEPEGNERLQRSYVRASWQLLTIDGLVTGIYLVAAGIGTLSPTSDALTMTAWRYLLYAAAWVALVCAPNRRLLRAPQWILLAAVGAFTLWESSPGIS